MGTKVIASTEAQNNFGRVLDDVVQNGTRYIIQRRNASQAVLISMADLQRLLESNAASREDVGNTLRELSPTYTYGAPVNER